MSSTRAGKYSYFGGRIGPQKWTNICREVDGMLRTHESSDMLVIPKKVS
jgi:hypothetical protein